MDGYNLIADYVLLNCDSYLIDGRALVTKWIFTGDYQLELIAYTVCIYYQRTKHSTLILIKGRVSIGGFFIGRNDGGTRERG